MQKVNRCTLIKPPETSWDAYLFEEQYQEEAKYNQGIYQPDVDNTLDDLADRLQEIGEECRVYVQTQTHQLHAEQPVPSRKDTRSLVESDTIITINPSPYLFGWLSSTLRKNPVMLAILGYTNRHEMENSYEMVGAHSVPVFQKVSENVQLHKMPRMLAFQPNNYEQRDLLLRQSMNRDNLPLFDLPDDYFDIRIS